jgi:hypothetical protein
MKYRPLKESDTANFPKKNKDGSHQNEGSHKMSMTGFKDKKDETLLECLAR